MYDLHDKSCLAFRLTPVKNLFSSKNCRGQLSVNLSLGFGNKKLYRFQEPVQLL